MRVLVLTSINPVIAIDAYTKISNYFEEKEKKLNFLCFPFFAEMKVQLEGGEYIPSYFSMIETSLQKEMQRKLYNSKNTVVIGNTYKDQKFDHIVLFDDLDPEHFDSYITRIKTDEELKEFGERVRINDLYTPEDASLTLPTIDHVNLFLWTSFFNNEEKHKAVND
jgi:hypothetical protein